MSRRRCALTALLATALSLTVAAPALAAVGLGGSPLNVLVGERGQLQAFRQDRTDPGVPPGIFYRPQQELGDAGFFLALPAAATVYGFTGSATGLFPSEYTPGTQGAVTGSGGAADPLRQVTTYAAGAALVTQTTTYVNGSQQFTIRWDVTNTGGTPLTYRAMAAADFYFDGDDAGTGIFTAGPPRFIGGTNVDSGSSGGFAEVAGFPAWTHYQAVDWPTIWSKVQAAATTSPFDDTVVATPVDNAGGVQWDDHLTTGLAAGATASYEIVVRSAVPSALQLNPTNAASRQRVPIAIAATALDSNGQPYAGKTLRYTLTGPNAGSGSTTLNASGAASITDPGTNAGTDTVTVYVDFNNNGTREPFEPQASALATFVDSVPPSCTLKVSGTLPGGGGSGKPLTVSVNCGEAARVSVATTLRLPAARASAAAAKKRKTIKLKTKTATVAPGHATRLKLKVPKSVARRYAGKTLKATMRITARDAAGNVKRTTVTRKVKLAKIKHKRR